MGEIRPLPWWRFDDFDDEPGEHPEPPAPTSWFDDLDQPRIDSWWDEREEAANGY